jgi:AMP-polyphosphate phosphotransferase
MARQLRDIDLSATMTKEESEQRIVAAQRRLAHLRLVTAGLLEPRTVGPGLIVVFEGFDAAGKGGAIRRIAWGLDPRHVLVAPVAAPTALELSHHFLWRFQSALPGRGQMTIFDRSWYGRLLVERVEHLIDHDTVRRSAREIVDFERGLVEAGTIIVKFWMHVSDDEQQRRFEERAADPLKQWKLTDEDWRNRAKREAYVEAADEMFAATDARHARWNLISGDNKHFARATVLETLVRRLEKALASLDVVVPPSRGDDYLERTN